MARLSHGLAIIEARTPPDPEKAFRAHTTYVTGSWRCGKVFAFKKLSAGDSGQLLCAIKTIATMSEQILFSVENTEGAGI